MVRRGSLPSLPMSFYNVSLHGQEESRGTTMINAYKESSDEQKPELGMEAGEFQCMPPKKPACSHHHVTCWQDGPTTPQMILDLEKVSTSMIMANLLYFQVAGNVLTCPLPGLRCQGTQDMHAIAWWRRSFRSWRFGTTPVFGFCWCRKFGRGGGWSHTGTAIDGQNPAPLGISYNYLLFLIYLGTVKKPLDFFSQGPLGAGFCSSKESQVPQCWPPRVASKKIKLPITRIKNN